MGALHTTNDVYKGREKAVVVPVCVVLWDEEADGMRKGLNGEETQEVMVFECHAREWEERGLKSEMVVTASVSCKRRERIMEGCGARL